MNPFVFYYTNLQLPKYHPEQEKKIHFTDQEYGLSVVGFFVWVIILTICFAPHNSETVGIFITFFAIYAAISGVVHALSLGLLPNAAEQRGQTLYQGNHNLAVILFCRLVFSGHVFMIWALLIYPVIASVNWLLEKAVGLIWTQPDPEPVIEGKEKPKKKEKPKEEPKSELESLIDPEMLKEFYNEI